MKNFNIKFNYVVFGGALILMTCSLAACNNNASTSNTDTNGAYSSNATNADGATAANTQTNSS